MVHFKCNIVVFAYKKNQLMIMTDIKTIFKKHNGYARMKEMKLAGIHTRDIASK